MLIFFSLIGGIISRLDGKYGNPYNFLFCLPYAAIVFFGLLDTVQCSVNPLTLPAQLVCPYPWYIWPLSLLAYVGATLGKSTGHGKFFDLGTWDKEADDERLEFIIKKLEGKVSTYVYDFIGLVLTGVAVSITPAILLFAISPYASLSLLCGGAAKGAAYAIGWRFSKKQTEIGEWLTGIFSYLSIYATFLILKG